MNQFKFKINVISEILGIVVTCNIYVPTIINHIKEEDSKNSHKTVANYMVYYL